MIKAFISYAREDEEYARNIFRFLRQNGYYPWMDKENLIPGSNWEREIEKAVETSDVQIFLLSSRSVEKRGVFQKEIRVALKKTELLLEDDISVIPLRIENCDVPDPIAKYQWLDLFEDGWEKQLLQAVFAAARQRGILEDKKEGGPIVSGFLTTDDSTEDGRLQITYSLPQIEVPNDPQIGRMIGDIFKGRASELILSFRRAAVELGERATREYPFEIDINSDVVHLSRNLVSLVMNVYQYIGGAHGYGFTRTLNVSIAEGSIFSAHDLFHDHAFINELINREAEETNEKPLIDGFDRDHAISVALQDNTSINSDGISIYFNQYELFCYAHGPVKFDVAWGSKYLANENLSEFGCRIKQQAKQ